MANIRLQNVLKREIQKLQDSKGWERHVAFLVLMLVRVFDLDEFEAEDALTEGKSDMGIDAMFELMEDGENILYVVQSKCFENADKSLDDGAKNKLVRTVSTYILGDYDVADVNARLKKKIVDVRDRLSEGRITRVGVAFLTNGQRPSEAIVCDLDNYKRDQGGQVFYEIYTEEDLGVVFMPESAVPVKEVELHVVKDVGAGDKVFLNMPSLEYVEGKVFRVDISEVAQMVRDNPNIFNSNVRAYQSIRHKVNEKIASTLRGSETLGEFVYLKTG
ncbi:MAG TPA: hypothetical protein VMW16_08910 [Sedimentisphaerales bacterium]|nr:hypothetical protein [Sedimentisphaerales bacterium]